MKSTLLKIAAHTVGAPVIVTGKSLRVGGTALITAGTATAAAGIKVEKVGIDLREKCRTKAAAAAELAAKEKQQKLSKSQAERLEALRREMAEIEAAQDAPMVPA